MTKSKISAKTRRPLLKVILHQLVLARLQDFLAAVEEDERNGIRYWKRKTIEDVFDDYVYSMAPTHIRA